MRRCSVGLGASPRCLGALDFVAMIGHASLQSQHVHALVVLLHTGKTGRVGVARNDHHHGQQKIEPEVLC
jgi:hypothetical protein